MCTLIWPRLWNFIGSQAKFNSFLVTNEHPERICLYLVREFDYEPSKIGHFQISKSIFGANCDLIFLKQKFLFEYQIRRTTFIKSIYFFDQSEKTLFSKNEPYFWWLVIKLSYKIQTNPFRMFICDHKTIEFHLTHHEMPRPWSCYWPIKMLDKTAAPLLLRIFWNIIAFWSMTSRPRWINLSLLLCPWLIKDTLDWNWSSIRPPPAV